MIFYSKGKSNGEAVLDEPYQLRDVAGIWVKSIGSAHWG